ncbi:MAG: hypothetical protein ACTSPY_08555 [Candidatus Helarchaeota archaeon]
MTDQSDKNKKFWNQCLLKFNEYLKSNDFKKSIQLVADEFNLSYDEAYKILFPPSH